MLEVLVTAVLLVVDVLDVDEVDDVDEVLEVELEVTDVLEVEEVDDVLDVLDEVLVATITWHTLWSTTASTPGLWLSASGSEMVNTLPVSLFVSQARRSMTDGDDTANTPTANTSAPLLKTKLPPRALNCERVLASTESKYNPASAVGSGRVHNLKAQKPAT